MEAVGAGASVIAFAGLALQSVKTIVELFSAIKDGPKSILDARHDVIQLQGVLERLSRFEGDDEALGNLLKRCSTDVSDFAGKVKKLSIFPGDRQRVRLWKHCCTVFSEKDLEKLRATIAGHIGALSLRLGIVHRYVGKSS